MINLDMEMPESCYECEIHNYHFCDITKKPIEYYLNADKREPHCPLSAASAVNVNITLDKEHMDEAIQAAIDTIKKEFVPKSVLSDIQDYIQEMGVIYVDFMPHINKLDVLAQIDKYISGHEGGHR